MVLMVRSFKITLNLLEKVSFAFFILLSTLAIYCVDAKPSIPNDMTLYQKRSSYLESQRKGATADLLPTELVLVSTLDGSIRGIDRFQGNVYWTLKGGPGSSLIKSNSKFTTHKSNKSGLNSENEDNEKMFIDTFNDVLTEPKDNDLSEFTFENQPSESSQEELEDNDTYYIIEPQDGGILYIYSDGKPLEKLPFSIEKIVSESPFRTPDGTIYMGRKNTLMIEIDPRNGKILQQFDINGVDDEYRMAAQSQYPARTIFLGRNEYKVSIFDKNKKLWNVTYSEYIPNKFEWDVPSSEMPTDIYIAPDANQAISGISIENGNLLWSTDLPYPVVSVFNVYRRGDSTVAVTRQTPPKSLETVRIGDMLSLMLSKNKETTAYVGIYNGTLYALSTKNYPLTCISQWSSMYTGRKPGDTNILIGGSVDPNSTDTDWTPPKPHEVCCHGCDYYIDCLIGQHRVQPLIDEVDDKQEARLPSPPSASIYLPSTTQSTTASIITASPSILPSLPSSGYEDYKEFKNDGEGFGRFWKSYLLIASVIGYIYRDRIFAFYHEKVLPRWKQMMKKRAKAKKTKERIAAAAKAEQERILRERADSITSLESFDASKIEHKKPIKIANVFEDEDEPVKEPEAIEYKTNQTEVNQDVNEKQEETIQEQVEQEQSSQKLVAIKKSSTGLDLENFKQSKSRVLEISDTVLGYGSHGTVVYKGVFDGRQVAVKRLLLDFYDVALKEVKLLQESDDHPNVVRYFYKEESDRFLYIALELCFGSLNDYMERSLPIPEMKLCDAMDPANVLSQITNGLQHLHSLKIVHRDIKPHNILLAPTKNRFTKDAPQMRVLISDFGLCKKLDGEQSSFHYTAASPAGTSGWRAPELLAGALAATSSDTSVSSSIRDDPNNMMGRVKATRAIDIFSAGCVFYYILSGGDHPFGNRFGRENNILIGNYDLSKLDSMGEDGVEAKDLVEKMIAAEPKLRPTADTISSHPFFWSTTKRLAFLQDASDRFEIEVRDPPSPLLQELESNAAKVIGTDWYKRIDRIVANDLGKFRKYDGKRVRDLLRALRNKKHHWQDLPEAVKKVYGEPPNQFLYYFTARFPHLLLHTYYVIANNPDLRNEGSLGQYF